MQEESGSRSTAVWDQCEKPLCQTILTCYIPEPAIYNLINDVSIFGGLYGTLKRIV